MDMLQEIAIGDYFDLEKISTSLEDHHLLGTEVYLRDIVFLATYLVTKLLIAIEGI